MFSKKTRHTLISAVAITVIPSIVGMMVFLQADDMNAEPDLAVGGNCGFVARPLGLSGSSCTHLEQDAEDAQELAPQMDTMSTKIELVSGKKRIIAGAGTYMAAAIVEKVDGRLVPDGTLVSFTRNGTEIGTARTLGGIAHIMDGNIAGAGEYNIVAQSSGASSPFNMVRVVAGEPVTLSIDRGDGIANPENESFIRLRTAALEDRFGNAIPDGSLLQYKGKDASGRGIILNSLVVNGIASVDLPGRELGGAVFMEPRYAEISGSGLQLDIGEIIIAETIQTITHIREGIVDLEIGPVLTAAGKLVHDGLPFTIDLSDGRRIETRTSNGAASFQFTHPSPGSTATVGLVSGSQFWRIHLDYASEAVSILRIRGGGDA